ncbi:UNVERIFIED_CONTAM: Mitochondrial matrix cochaperone [Siphonaria sp. JEL0065]|nr:Mitochondrial matrix cochaperone [Siphonaria sp. JEL0065]
MFACLRSTTASSIRVLCAPLTVRPLPSTFAGLRKYSSETAGKKPEQQQDMPGDKLAVDLAEKDRQISDLQDLYRRSLADMENVRQRTKKEVENASSFAVTKFAKDLLDTADVLEIALKSVPEAERANDANKVMKDFYSGVSMTHTNLLKTFKRVGVEPFENTLGAKFDHNLHEAIFQAPVPGKQPGTVLEVLKSGYMIKGRVLRSAQVGVVTDSSS